MAYCNHHTLSNSSCKDKNRIERLHVIMEQRGVEALLIESEVNRLYLTRSRISKGILLVTGQEAVLLVDFRFWQQAKAEVRNCDVLQSQDSYKDALKLLRQWGCKSYRIEKRRMTVTSYDMLSRCGDSAISIDKVGGDNLLDMMREIKDSEELEYFREAQRITDKTFAHIGNMIRPGVRESALKMELGNYMVKQGSENYSMNFIVLCGERTAYPHGCSGDVEIKNGDFLMMDFGAMVGGYSADMTRTVAVGNVNSQMQEIYDIVLEAQNRSLRFAGPGVRCRDLDAIARDYIRAQGYDGFFGHGLGHSLGLEIHENPRCNGVCEGILEPGMMMTVEPGIYLPGKFGVRIEDMGVVTEDGFENMTGSFK